MVTAVDTSVLLDVLLNDPQHSGAHYFTQLQVWDPTPAS